MRADLEQDIDGKLWLLVDGPDGQTYKISHDTATAPPDLPPIKLPDPEAIRWSAGYQYFGVAPISPDLWKACIL